MVQLSPLVPSCGDASASQFSPPYHTGAHCPVASAEFSDDGTDAQRALLNVASLSQLMTEHLFEQKEQLNQHLLNIETLLTLKLAGHLDSVNALLKSPVGRGSSTRQSQRQHENKSSVGSSVSRCILPVKDQQENGIDGVMTALSQESYSSEHSPSENKKEHRERAIRNYMDLLDWRAPSRMKGITSSKIEAFSAGLLKRRLSCTVMHRIVESKLFNALVVLLIVLNAVFNGILSDQTLKNVIMIYVDEHASGFGDDRPNALEPKWGSPIEIAFCMIFSIELLIRILALEGAFLIGPEWKWNLMDTVLVFTSIVDITLSASGLGLSHVRTLRIMRITRVLRLMRFSTTIQLMLLSALNSAIPFVCAMFLISLLIFLFATVMVQGVIWYVDVNADSNLDTTNKLLRFFDSVPMALLSLFMVVSGGVSWIEIAEPLMEISAGYVVLLIVFVAIMVLTVLNIVTAIFVSEAVETAKCNREIATQSEIKRTQAMAMEFLRVFSELDINGSGTITEDEFLRCMDMLEYRHYFSAMGLDVSNASRVFNLLDIDGSGELEIEEFVVGCIDLKGGATAVTMEKLMKENRKLMTRWTKGFGHLESVVKQASALTR